MPVWSFLRRLLARRPRRTPAVVRDELRAFLADGRAFLAACEDESRPAPVPLAHRWAERAEAFLLAHLGPGYVFTFRGRTDLPSEHDTTHPDHRVILWRALRVRVAVLEKFLAAG